MKSECYNYSRFINKALKIIFLVALFLIPVYFATFFKSFNIFNLNKIFVFRLFLNLAFLLTVAREIIHPSSLILNLKSFFYKYWLWPCIFILLLGLSLIFSENIWLSFFGSIDRQQGYLNYFLYFLWFIILSFNLSVFKEQAIKKDDLTSFKKYLKKILVVMVLAGGVTSIYGILQILNIDFQEWTNLAYISKRASSTFGNPNFFASWILLVIPATVYLFISAKNTYIKLIYFLLSIFGLISVFITGSRAGLLGLFFSIFLLLLYLLFIKKISIRKKILGIIIFIFFLISSLAIYNQIFPGKIKHTINLANVEERLDFYEAAISAIKEKPIFGYGQENLVGVFASYYRPDWGLRTIGQIPDRAHNIFLDILMFGGFTALIAFFIIYLHFFKLSYINLKNKENRGAILSIAIGALAYLFTLLFGFSIPAGEIYIFTFLALLVAYNFKPLNYFKNVVKRNNGSLINLSCLTSSQKNNLKLALLILFICFSFLFIQRTINIIKADHYFAKAVLSWNRANYADSIRYFRIVDDSNINKISLAYYQNYSVDKIINTYSFVDPSLQNIFLNRIVYLNENLSGKEFYIMVSKAKIKGALGHFSEASKILENLKKEAPYLPTLNIEEARLHILMNNSEAARISLEKALDNMPEYQGGSSPFHYVIFYSLADIYKEQGQLSEAQKYYKLAFRTNSEDLRLLKMIRNTNFTSPIAE